MARYIQVSDEAYKKIAKEKADKGLKHLKTALDSLLGIEQQSIFNGAKEK